ncbi:MAG: glutathione peroxidase [Crocinitomicaceae bacterium]|nr:glutathione peroxidase [Crocinitomicaceae bacterium]
MKTIFFIIFILLTCNSMAQSTSIYDYSFTSIEGKNISLNQFKGKKILFVNVASRCGFTSQYKELQVLHEKYQDKLVLIGFPCDQFGGQEPGTEKEIQAFCQKNYGVDFIMSEKINVKGKNQHPIYSWLTQSSLNGVKNSSVLWNFQKYLVDEKGAYIDYYTSITSPTSTKIMRHLK